MGKLAFIFFFILHLILLSNSLYSIIILVLILIVFLTIVTRRMYCLSLIFITGLAIISFNRYLLININGPILYSGNIGLSHSFEGGKIRSKEKLEGLEIGRRYYINGDYSKLKNKTGGALFEINRIDSIYPGEKTISYYGEKIRGFLNKNILDKLGKKHGSYISSLILGIKDNFLNDRVNNLQYLGLIHIISISGFHINLIEALFKKTRFKKISLIFLTFYILIIDTIPGYRCLFMRLSSEVGALLKRDTSPYNDLLNAMIFQVFLNPFLIFNLSFILTYAASLGILLIPKLTKEYLTHPRLNILNNEDIHLTLGSSFLTAPALSIISPGFNLSVFITNIVIVNMYSYYIKIGFFFCFLSQIIKKEVIGYLIFILDFILGIITLLEYLFSKISIQISYYNLPLVYLILLFIIYSSYLESKKVPKGHLAITGILLANLFFLNPHIDKVVFESKFNNYTLRIINSKRDISFVNIKSYKKSLRYNSILVDRPIKYGDYEVKAGNKVPELIYNGHRIVPKFDEAREVSRVVFFRIGNFFIK